MFTRDDKLIYEAYSRPELTKDGYLKIYVWKLCDEWVLLNDPTHKIPTGQKLQWEEDDKIYYGVLTDEKCWIPEQEGPSKEENLCYKVKCAPKYIVDQNLTDKYSDDQLSKMNDLEGI